MGDYTGKVPDTAARQLDWMERAACIGERAIFDDASREYEARVICIARCPVRSQCLAYIKEAELGQHRDQRDGVAAGLTYDERHRLDDQAQHRKDDGDPIVFDGFERCGTRIALLKHLWFDEPIDSKCWTGEVFREHENRSRRVRDGVVLGPEPVVEQESPVQLIPKPKPPVRGDTPHERRVYTLWSSGLTDLDVARRMAVSVPSVQRVRERLGLLANLPERKAS